MAGLYGNEGMTAQSGLQLLGGIATLDTLMRRNREERATNEAVAAADAIDRGQNIEGFSPAARQAGARIYWENQLRKAQAEREKHLSTEEGVKAKVATAALNTQQLGQRWNQYLALKDVDPETAKKLAVKMVNENMYNGLNVERIAEGGYSIRKLSDGTTEKVGEMTMDEITEFLRGYMGMGHEELMERTANAEQYRARKNAEAMAKGEVWFNKKNANDFIIRVPAGTIDPIDGQWRDEMFIDPVSKRIIPPEVAKNYAPSGVSKEVRERRESEAEIGLRQAQTGRLKQETAGLRIGRADTAEEKRQYDLLAKQLENELRRFNKKIPAGAVMKSLPDGTFEFVTEAQNAINDAYDLARKYETNAFDLTLKEKEMLPHALRAVEMYEKLSDIGAQSYGLSPETKTPFMPKPPPAGYTLD